VAANKVSMLASHKPGQSFQSLNYYIGLNYVGLGLRLTKLEIVFRMKYFPSNGVSDSNCP